MIPRIGSVHEDLSVALDLQMMKAEGSVSFPGVPKRRVPPSMLNARC